MKGKARPWATILLTLFVALGAIFVELVALRVTPGGMLVLALPFLGLGYVIDWVRLTRPSPFRALMALGLSAMALLTPIAILSEVGRGVILIAAIVLTLTLCIAHFRVHWLRRVVEATYVGEREGRSVFVRQGECWVMLCESPFSMRPGEAVAFRFRGTRQNRSNDGPFRSRDEYRGRIVEIASSRHSLQSRRRTTARWLTKCSAMAALAVVAELAFLALFLSF